MKSKELGDYLKTNAKPSGDFIPIFLPSAYHAIEVLVHFFSQKKHEWMAFCFFDDILHCHAIWLEKGQDVNGVNPSISYVDAIKFSQLNDFKYILMSHNHTVTSDDVSYFKSYGVNIKSSSDIKRQQFLKFSPMDEFYSKIFLERCEQKGIGFAYSVIVNDEYLIKGNQEVRKNLAANKPANRGIFYNTGKSTYSPQPYSIKKIIFKPEDQTCKSREYKGLIGYYGLSDWWNSSFSFEEQKYIAKYFNELFDSFYGDYEDSRKNRKLKDLSPCKLMEEDKEGLSFWKEPLAEFLSDLFMGLDKKNLQISLKIFEKAEELLKNSYPLTELHNFFSFIITRTYSPRYDIEGTEFALYVCKKQINISHIASKIFKNNPNDSMPYHLGYQKLAIQKEKKKKYLEVIELCEKAQSEGWNGDWQKRIDRCKKRLNRL